MGTPVFAALCRFYFSAVAVSQELCPVTNSQNGIFSPYLRQVGLESLAVVYRERTTRQYDAFDVLIVIREFIIRQYLAVDIELPHTAAYELRSLRAEIENDDFFLHIC